jgi:hypothetical protein
MAIFSLSYDASLRVLAASGAHSRPAPLARLGASVCHSHLRGPTSDLASLPSRSSTPQAVVLAHHRHLHLLLAPHGQPAAARLDRGRAPQRRQGKLKAAAAPLQPHALLATAPRMPPRTLLDSTASPHTACAALPALPQESCADPRDVELRLAEPGPRLPFPFPCPARLFGLQVLGTFITEWEEGRHRCEALLASPESARAVAEQLAGMALHFGFEVRHHRSSRNACAGPEEQQQ